MCAEKTDTFLFLYTLSGIFIGSCFIVDVRIYKITHVILIFTKHRTQRLLSAIFGAFLPDAVRPGNW